MNSSERDRLGGFLAARPLCEETSTDGRDRVRFLLGDAVPPLEYIRSVRCLVLKEDAVLVLRNREGQMHLLPGGHREAGESLEQTLRREVLEETGWTLDAPRLIGCIHVELLEAKPAGYSYSYPHFFSPIYTAAPKDFQPEAILPGDYEEASAFHPLSQIDH